MRIGRSGRRGENDLRAHPEAGRAGTKRQTPPRPSGQFSEVIRPFTSARSVPAYAGANDKNPVGSRHYGAWIIPPRQLDRNQILCRKCQDSALKRLTQCPESSKADNCSQIDNCPQRKSSNCGIYRRFNSEKIHGEAERQVIPHVIALSPTANRHFCLSVN